MKKYDRNKKAYLDSEIAKTLLTKKDIANELGIDYTMLTSATNGIIACWADKIREEVIVFLKNYNSNEH